MPRSGRRSGAETGQGTGQVGDFDVTREFFRRVGKLARQLLLFNRSIPIEETIAKIEEVGVEDVRAAAETIFASKPTYALVGNVDGHYGYDEICRLLKA